MSLHGSDTTLGGGGQLAAMLGDACTFDRVEGIASPAILPAVARQFTVRSAITGTRREGHHAAGRLCAREALRSLDERLADLPVGRTERGAPVWPGGVVGSITHTEGIASAAVAWSRDLLSIGIDSERIASQAQAKNISALIAWPVELSYAKAAGLDALQAITLVFSAKETIFKCLFPLVARTFDFSDVRIVAIDGAARTFNARVVTALSARVTAGMNLDGQFDLDALMVHTGMVLPAHASFGPAHP